MLPTAELTALVTGGGTTLGPVWTDFGERDVERAAYSCWSNMF